MDVQKFELERQILVYKNKINQLDENNRTAKKNIGDCNKAYNQITKKIRETEDTYNSRLKSVSSKSSYLPSGSNFGANYYNKLKEILFGKNTDSALTALKNTQTSILKKIDSYEESIKSNNSKILFYKEKITEIKTQISNLEVDD